MSKQATIPLLHYQFFEKIAFVRKIFVTFAMIYCIIGYHG
jgi:hypothetical protein